MKIKKIMKLIINVYFRTNAMKEYYLIVNKTTIHVKLDPNRVKLIIILKTLYKMICCYRKFIF